INHIDSKYFIHRGKIDSRNEVHLQWFGATVFNRTAHHNIHIGYTNILVIDAQDSFANDSKGSEVVVVQMRDLILPKKVEIYRIFSARCPWRNEAVAFIFKNDQVLCV
ncbi:MAG TPA: hypothetical protein VKB86_03165, partial [Pyrinomonadaceae bacterium]|nr:hypothetical protein [Pyrinomonadaceae bacterium]